MRGQPKRLSRDYLRRNGGNTILYFDFVSYCLEHSQPSFRSVGLSFLLYSFGFFLVFEGAPISDLAVYSVLGNLTKQT